jgi:NADPH:quinone reductase-like Zn-dependent oxidoreductase
MLLQILKLQGFSPIVAVVGRSHKKAYCQSLGADFVIDKSAVKDIWAEARKLSPGGFAAIFDANGLETLQSSYDNLSMCGTLVTYGFHSNLPHSALLSPINWLQMIWGMINMPKFDPMQMVLDSKTVSGFNLSFFADEKDLIDLYLKQLMEWVDKGKITVQDATVFDMKDIGRAHELIQSGSSVGKIVLSTLNNT